MDLIDRQDAIGKIQTWLKHSGYSEGERNVMGCAIQMLESLPSAESETARIIIGRSMSGMTMWYQCDMCNEPVDEHDAFCSGCGRRFVHE